MQSRATFREERLYHVAVPQHNCALPPSHPLAVAVPEEMYWVIRENLMFRKAIIYHNDWEKHCIFDLFKAQGVPHDHAHSPFFLKDVPSAARGSGASSAAPTTPARSSDREASVVLACCAVGCR